MRVYLPSHRPDREHGDADRDELQQHTEPHQLLRGVGRSALHHVDETEQQHECARADRDRQYDLAEKEIHPRYITPCTARRHRCFQAIFPAISGRNRSCARSPGCPVKVVRSLYNVVMDAFYTSLADDGWAIASHIALSTLMALFPFLIVLPSLAGFFFGSKELADQAASLFLQT